MNKLSDIEKIALGKRLTLFRNALEMTQEEFGNAIGKGRTTIFSWEKGKTQPPEHYMRIIEKATWNRNSEPVRVNPDYIRKGAEPMFLPVKTFTGSAQVEIGGQIKEGGFIAAPPEDEVAIIPDNHEKITRLRSQVADTIKKTNSHPGIKVWAYAGAGNPFNADPGIMVKSDNPASGSRVVPEDRLEEEVNVIGRIAWIFGTRKPVKKD